MGLLRRWEGPSSGISPNNIVVMTGLMSFGDVMTDGGAAFRGMKSPFGGVKQWRIQDLAKGGANLPKRAPCPGGPLKL